MKSILPDTSVVVDFLRRRETVFPIFRQLLAEKRLALSGIVLSEVLVGMRDAKQRELLCAMEKALPFVETSRPVFVRAGELGARLREEGRLIPLTDLLVAATALEHGLDLWTSDAHFKRIPGLTFFSI